MKRTTKPQLEKTSFSGTKNFALSIFLAVIMMIGNSYLWDVQAQGSPAADQDQTAPSTESAPAAVGLTTCSSDLDAFGTAEFDKLKVWVEQHFSNKSKTKDLLDVARVRYGQYIEALQTKYEEVAKAQIGGRGAPAARQGQLFADCQYVVEDYVQRANDLLKLRAETSSAIKRTSVFIEKYEQIITKLRTLNLNVLKLTVSLTSFEQKLPCYLKSCI